jgi:hypothetical protein
MTRMNISVFPGTCRQMLLAPVFALLCTACFCPGAEKGFEGLVPFDPDVHAGINPQIEASTGRSDYMLRYQVSKDGKSIKTRFIGPSEALGAPLHIRESAMGAWHLLTCRVADSDYQVTMAKWRLGENGEIETAFVRIEPFVEWRALEKRPDQLVVDVEWRPLVDGCGVGPWNR